LYVGTCAGAYFPLKFNFPPLDYFNLLDCDVRNFAIHPPEPVLYTEKFSCPYGDGFIFHPVREDVKIQFSSGQIIHAPLYGGPAFSIHDDSVCLARYDSFTEKTIFLCDKNYAEKIYLNQPAIILKKYGDGSLLLFGPHFEHPYYKEANKKLLELINQFAVKDINSPPPRTPEGKLPIDEVKKICSNMRIMANGLVGMNWKWKLGRKTYEVEKIAFFINFVWRRIKLQRDFLVISPDEQNELLDSFITTMELLKKLKMDNSIENFENLLKNLKHSVALYLKAHFHSIKTKENKLYA